MKYTPLKFPNAEHLKQALNNNAWKTAVHIICTAVISQFTIYIVSGYSELQKTLIFNKKFCVYLKNQKVMIFNKTVFAAALKSQKFITKDRCLCAGRLANFH